MTQSGQAASYIPSKFPLSPRIEALKRIRAKLRGKRG